MPEDRKHLLPPHLAENARENIWIYRSYQGLSRKQLAGGTLKSSLIRGYEYGFLTIQPKHLEMIAEKLNMRVEDLTAPPDDTLLLNRQTRRMVEYYRRLNDQQRHIIKLLMLRMEG